MSLFGALGELVAGAALTSAPACDLALSEAAVGDRAGFVTWIAKREEMRDLRGMVEAIGREIWTGAETRGLAQRDLEQHIRGAAAILGELRPSAALLAEVAAAARSNKSATQASEPVARRIARDIVGRARAAGAFAGGAGMPLLREEVILFLLDRAFMQLVDEDRRLMRLGPALADFGTDMTGDTKPTGGKVAGLAALGISRGFAQQLELVGGTRFLADLGERLGLSERAVRRLVALVDGQAIEAEGRIARLESVAQWLADVRAQLMRPANDDVEVRRLKSAAASALAEGDFEGAMDALRHVRRELRETRRRTEERLQDEAVALRAQMIEEARATARLAELLAARGEHAQAADLFSEAALALPRADRETSWRFNLQRADSLLAHAKERGDGGALSEALAAYGTLVRSAAETTNAKALAEACLGHGDALHAAGERDPGGGRLKDAITIYQKAIQLMEREKDHAGLRRARVSLAKAMARQGERDGSVETLQEAAQAFREAAALMAAEKMPIDHATVKMALGGVLLAIEERQGGGLPLLVEAAEAYRTAVGLLDAETDSERWGEAQMNLGLALLGAGEQEGSSARLEGAITAFRAALDVTARVKAPRRWALTQMNLGNALAALGDRDIKSTTLLDEAIEAYNAALEEFLQEAEPLKWAITQMNLGNAHIRLGERKDRRRHWLAAAAALVPALEVFEQQGAADLAEMTRRNLKRFQESWDSVLAPPGASASAAADKAPAEKPKLAKVG